MIETAVIIVYTLALAVIFLYSLAQLNLLINYLKAKKSTENAPVFNFSKSEEIPLVTVQLPLYNEMYVVERLLESVAKIDYPKDKLEIQVLDDSTDASLETTRKQVEHLKAQGLDIQHINQHKTTGIRHRKFCTR